MTDPGAQQQGRLSRGWFGKVAAAIFIALAALATYELRITPSAPGWHMEFANIVEARKFPEQPELLLRTEYTGIASVDYGLQFLVAAFLPGAAGFVKDFEVLQAYFLISFFSIISIYSVEAGRRGNKRAWTYYTSIWALLYQTVGGAIIIALYCLAFMRDTARLEYYSAPAMRVPLGYARSLAPALVLGFLLPTVAIYLPFNDPGLNTKQALVALWQPTPFFVNGLLLVLPRIFSAASTKPESDTADGDATYVKNLYRTCMVVTAIAHIIMLAHFGVLDSHVSFAHVFLPDSTRFPDSGAEILHFIFQWDYLIIFGASLLWACVAIYDLSIIGRVKLNVTWLISVIVVGSVVFGPAATIAFAFMWREERMRKDSKVKV